MKLSISIFTKFFLIFFANLLLFFRLSPILEAIILLYLSSLFFLVGNKKLATRWLLISLGCILLNQLALQFTSNFLGHLLLFFSSGLKKLLPVIIIGNFIFATTKISELFYGLKKLHLPNWIIIPISVLFRFLPTIRQDHQQIRNAMKFRGIAINQRDLLKHPLETLEYIYVPLLNNANTVANDLTAAALTRGITHPANSTSLYLISFKKIDIAIFLVTLLMFGGVIYARIQGS
ncbi:MULTISPECIES: energy-coupling factor transporter transmembrane component T [unclassified Enterococcus]|uniref:energy-coupling factor transporter transmembrane component T n=1 Tax=unclassified Enterococcus TaxID=2608891 RepID=UPI0015537173|nr:MULTISPECIES: energy-coupling factor transporter transmembrane component T [unclassified Enterococcus]MBS7578247.1 energy-coupling factor transporter transmembrane protein EcfT [Enterococcus sp. MMGLQ5-2]MBS7585514.1 energy-coupling factor transporter transmembrane protein EcfT [Enterococcus sp. MMGLQ5-1]NPD13373.1 energy-coupling factor transporter transmembrane protein EcfT [Enterococcus sp. MMGLQ5-1]NPD38078.1 energy-coupling factor transporter transmembrane protein EcfT [Enterococcus sp.